MNKTKIAERNVAFVVLVLAALSLGRLTCFAVPTETGKGATQEVAAAFAGEVRLILPEIIYAAPGIEMNVYFDNVVLVVNSRNYLFDVTCPKGRQQSERWTFQPSAGDVGTYPFTLEVRDQQNAVVARATSTVRVAPSDAGAGRAMSMLMIGDSLTSAAVYPQRVFDLCAAPGNPRLTLIGSCRRGAKGEIGVEGYGGWTAGRFLIFSENARKGDKTGGSPFMFKGADGKPKLDFQQYCAEMNGGKPPDFVTVLLGGNDIWSATDETIESRISVMFHWLDQLFGMIHEVDPNIKIGLLLPITPAATQDAFGNCYKKCGQGRWWFRRKQHRLVERMSASYGNRQARNIWLVPANANLDCVHNYPEMTVPWNAHATDKGIRQNNSHPAASGYRQIGDTVYGWLKATLADNPGVAEGELDNMAKK